MLRGKDTFKIKEICKRHGGRWNPNTKGWVFSSYNDNMIQFLKTNYIDLYSNYFNEKLEVKCDDSNSQDSDDSDSNEKKEEEITKKKRKIEKCLMLGAFIKGTKEYVHPGLGKKEETYVCPDCWKDDNDADNDVDNDVVFCKGEKIRPYFRHKANSNCTYYNKPSESQIHKDAKLLLKRLIDNSKSISIKKNCSQCLSDEVILLSKDDSFKAIIEYRFQYYNGEKVADIAYVNIKEEKKYNINHIKYIFEICYKHKTKTENRPEPWFEFDAEYLIRNADNFSDDLVLQCSKDACLDCLKKDDQELYISRILGKRIKTNTHKNCLAEKKCSENPKEETCNNCKHNMFLIEDDNLLFCRLDKNLDTIEKINKRIEDYDSYYKMKIKIIKIDDEEYVKKYECLIYTKIEPHKPLPVIGRIFMNYRNNVFTSIYSAIYHGCEEIKWHKEAFRTRNCTHKHIEYLSEDIYICSNCGSSVDY